LSKNKEKKETNQKKEEGQNKELEKKETKGKEKIIEEIAGMPLKRYLYPDAKSLFAFSPLKLEDIKDNCYIMLDTNVLLGPYQTSSRALEEFEKIYKELINKERLYVPGEVAREFIHNKGQLIADIYKKILDESSKFPSSIPLYNNYPPILEKVKEFEDLHKTMKDIKETLDKKKEEHSSAKNNLLEQIKSWYYEDPVSKVYKDLFKEDVIFDLPLA